MNSRVCRGRFAGIVGNFLEHYDNALFGLLSPFKVMIVGAVCSALFAIPMFYLLDHASLGTVIAVRLAIISFGVAFSALYYAWAIERVLPRHRYLILSLGGAFGSQFIGMPTSAICLWLYQTFGWNWTPGFYLQATSIIVGLSVFLFMRKEKVLDWRSK